MESKVIQIEPFTENDRARFWSRVQINGSNECWPWIAYRNGAGYGNWRGPEGKTLYAHRVAYTLLVGEIPNGITIDHTCKGKCCNPAHMAQMTQSENSSKPKVDSCRCGNPRRGTHDSRCFACYNAYMRDYLQQRRNRQKTI